MYLRGVCILSLAILIAPEAKACGCIDDRPWTEIVDSSDVLFTGRLISHRTVHIFDNLMWLELPSWLVPSDQERHESLLFEVDRWWKGEPRQRIEIRTDHSSCAMTIPDTGEEMLIEANAWGGILFTWLCMRSVPVLTSEELDSTLIAYPEYSGAPWLVTRDTLGRHLGSGYSPESNGQSGSTFVLVVAILILAAGAVWWFRFK